MINTTHNLRVLALIQAKMVQVEGMKAANLRSSYNQCDVVYTEFHFLCIVDEIEKLAGSFE